MSDIFLSYASEDVARANELAHALSRYGWSVWWDRSILPGKVFDTVIEAELSAAKCVIVLWSMHSVESRWVRAEAGEALDKGRLIPVLLDGAVIPLVFRQVQAASLSGWDSDPAHLGFQRLVSAISAVVPPQSTSATSQASDTAHNTGNAIPQAETRTRHTGWWAFIALCVLVIAGGAFYFLRGAQTDWTPPIAVDQQPEPSPPLIAVSPAPPSTQPKQISPSIEPADTKPVQTTTTQPPDVAESAKPAATAPISESSKPVPSKPAPSNKAGPVVKQATPVLVKPTVSAAKPAPSTETVTKAEPAQSAVKPAAPLTVLAVVWAMPNDNGVASTARTQEYSTRLSRMVTAVVDEAMSAPVRFEYYYPDQQEYYRLLKDQGKHQALCSSHRADLVIAGFVKGAEYVSSSYGYALTRNPVFSVYDCKTNVKITQTYQVAEKVGDSFPFEQSTMSAFRKFVQQEAALANY
jgi:hypothetical protein